MVRKLYWWPRVVIVALTFLATCGVIVFLAYVFY